MINTKLSAITYFVKTYFTVLPELLYRFTIGTLLNPQKTQAIIHQFLNSKDLVTKDKKIKTVEVTDYINAELFDISLIGKYYISKSSETRNLKELASLAFLVKSIKPKAIFEFGTFVGRTTSLLALNTDDDCTIHTIDLPQADVQHIIGEEYKGKQFSKRIIQYNSDSRKFDFEKLLSKIDFVWVDACHDYEFVKKDTENAFNICKPGGIIAWHDYRPTAWWSGVTMCLRELNKNKLNIHHINGTTIAFCINQIK